jgi:excisionase family DNA binding protein
MTVQEVAELLCVSRRTAYALVAAGEVPKIRVGGQLRISREALDDYLAHGVAR